VVADEMLGRIAQALAVLAGQIAQPERVGDRRREFLELVRQPETDFQRIAGRLVAFEVIEVDESGRDERLRRDTEFARDPDLERRVLDELVRHRDARGCRVAVEDLVAGQVRDRIEDALLVLVRRRAEEPRRQHQRAC